MTYKEAMAVKAALNHCIADDCSESCPGKDEEWIERGLAACRHFSDAHTDMPTLLAIKAAEAIDTLKNLLPHMMTEAEARENAFSYGSLVDSVKPVFVQFRYEEYQDEGLTPPWRGGHNQRALLKGDRYGKDYVFWTDRPSPEQKEGMKWE